MTAAKRRGLIEAAGVELFAERGYAAAPIDEIAARAGVSPPVLYEHFDSKLALYRSLLERHFAELREVWRDHLGGEEDPEKRIAHSIDAWFAYVEEHPFAGRMLFRDTSGDPKVAAVHEEVASASRAQVLAMLGDPEQAAGIVGVVPADELEMVWVVLREVLQGIAIWWVDHPDVPREKLVATVMNWLWVGFERVAEGEGFRPDALR